jgi:hypothetical protein
VIFSAISFEHDHYDIARNTFQAELPPFLVIQQKCKSELDANDSDDEARKKQLKLTKEKEEKDKPLYRLGEYGEEPKHSQ